jgi:hypothetical protein
MVRAMNHRRRRAIGTMLLEVVVALALLILGLGVIGVQFRYANLSAHKNKDLTTAMMLAESKCAETTASTVELEEEQDGDFGDAFPDFTWRLLVEPAEIEGLERYQLEIYQGDPDNLPRIEDRQKLLTTYWLRAERENVDLARDFGLTEEQVAQLTEVMPMENFDPSNVDPGLLADMDEEAIAQIMPELLSALGVGGLTGSGGESDFFTLASMLRALAPQAGHGQGAPGAQEPGLVPPSTGTPGLPGQADSGTDTRMGRGGHPVGRGLEPGAPRRDTRRRGGKPLPQQGQTPDSSGGGQPDVRPPSGGNPGGSSPANDQRSGRDRSGQGKGQDQRKPLEK